MAKVQIYLSDETYKDIEQQLITHRGEKGRQESFSSFSSMLLELGLRVYKAQRESVADPFDQASFNKTLLENVLLTSFTMSKLLGINSHNTEIQGLSHFVMRDMVNDIKTKTSDEMLKIFTVKDEFE
ncbi:relaxosome protein TraM [Serratia marcescens]|uniref:conjugal transfer relaxosome DNA-binding protein TraM n=1 Tax=Serratia TaxID=613 RepID=UPI000576F2C9|nr:MULTISPECIES: conjugal transfer relaxosome DNA-binding protein TraM [Serratia]MBJ2078325.1 relaxosome protein TraM [Serratia ureilytica]MDM3535888.1 relaxosome protein TraM [Serratia marcescens]UYU06656.1 relaxosome protein TraM [Serratia marcescens]HEJ7174897.1 relaxosome protein TraM [Serratia marcescens]